MTRPLAENARGYARNNGHIVGCVAPRLTIDPSVQVRWIASQFTKPKLYQKLIKHVKLSFVLLYYATNCVVGGLAELGDTGGPYNVGTIACDRRASGAVFRTHDQDSIAQGGQSLRRPLGLGA